MVEFWNYAKKFYNFGRLFKGITLRCLKFRGGEGGQRFFFNGSFPYVMKVVIDGELENLG